MIGIVGGVGPLAGLDLFRKITEQTSAGNDQEHLPVILLSLPGKIADRTDYLEGRIQENPGIAMGEACIALSRAGALVAGIPCNTAHAPEIFNCLTDIMKKACCTMQIVHMVHVTMSYITESVPEKSAIGLLGTRGTYRSKIYQKRLIQAGYLPVVPDEIAQNELVHNAVYHPEYGIKSQSGRITEQAKSQLVIALDGLINRGVSAIILGCSEITLAFKEQEYRGVKLIDPVKLLAKALIEIYLTATKT